MNKVVVITGGSKGIGKALAVAFIVKGAQVVISSRSKVELDAAAKEIGATPFVADVTKSGDVAALAAFTVKTFDRIDIWINNAGVWMPHSPLQNLDLERVRQMFDINVFGLMYGTKVALIEMQKQGSGTIINISSTSGLSGKPNSSGYASSKWAVRGFTDSIREECKGTNIKILTVYPGGTKTNLFDEAPRADYKDFMTPESVAEKIVINLELPNPEPELIINRPK
ncbi:MAG: SDR family oxidoreductase [Patescibacteria group bacterium]